MHLNLPVFIVAFGVTLASCAAHRDAVRTPFGAYRVNYEQGPTERAVRATGRMTRHYSPDANDSIRGFGFANGYDGEQILISGLRLSDGSRVIPLPESVTADLWNLDLDSGRYSRIRTIDGLEGYSLHGSDGERGYTVVFFFSGDRYVGRVVSTLFWDIWFQQPGRGVPVA